MIYGNESQKAVFTLSLEETTAFEHGKTITCPVTGVNGMWEIVLQKRTVCPLPSTQEFLRNLMKERVSRMEPDDLTVTGVIALLTDQVDIRNDLERFEKTIGGATPIKELI
jgi:hypothetical protein